MFECKDGASDPGKPVELDVVFEKVDSEHGDTPSGATPLSGTLTHSGATLVSGANHDVVSALPGKRSYNGT